jgi:hypothetical protein
MTQPSSGTGVPGEPLANDSPGTSRAGYCTACGSPHAAGQSYCGRCGSRLIQDAGADRPPSRADSTSPGAEPGAGGAAAPDSQLAGPAADDMPYRAGATIGAVFLSLFMPVIALIVALVLRSQELRPKRRQFLKNWAVGSVAWLCTGWLIGLIALSSASSGPSGCQGGIDQAVPPSYQSNDGVHWEATFTCMNGGTETKPVPSSEVPGGG